MHSRHGLRLAAALTLVLGVTGIANAKPWDNDDHPNRPANNLRARPFIFVGTAAQCGGPAGSNIVTSAWLGGMGLPDNGGPNSPNPATARDPHTGLLLNKNGPTADCSAAGAVIEGFRRGSTITELGFDFRDGTHCGAGAPRFNVTSEAGFTYFVGCASGAKAPAPQDPQWIRVRFTAANFFPASPSAPPFAFGPNGTRVRSIAIIFDEGTDQGSPNDPNGVGLSVLDNIDVNGVLIRQGNGIVPKARGNNGFGFNHADDDDD